MGHGKLIVLLALAGATVIVAIGTALFGSRARARRRLARGGTTLEEGAIVTLTGKVRAIGGERLTAPLTEKPCVAYAVRAFELRLGQRNPDLTAIGESQMIPFELVLPDRAIVVDGTEAELVLPVFPIIPRKLEREHAFMAAHGASVWVHDHSFEEVSVADGDKITVQGVVVAVVIPEGETLREPTVKLRLVAYADHPITIGVPR